MLLVEIQKPDCCPPFRACANNAPINFQTKMFVPTVLARVKQGNEILFASTLKIDRRDVWPLLQIAMQATEAKIIFVINATMLLRDNVINLAREDRCSLRQATILASLPRPPPYTRSRLRG